MDFALGLFCGICLGWAWFALKADTHRSIALDAEHKGRDDSSP